MAASHGRCFLVSEAQDAQSALDAIRRCGADLMVQATQNASIGGAFYTGSLYPSTYQSRYFFGDYGKDWIKVAAFVKEAKRA